MSKKERNFYSIAFFISLVVILITSIYLFKPEETIDEPLVLNNNEFTLYTSLKTNEDINYIFKESSSSDVNYFIRDINSKSLKEIDGIEIFINKKDKNISIKKVDENINLKDIYMNLKTELQSNKGIYHSLLNQLEFDFVGEVKNIEFNIDNNEILIKSSNLDKLDVRFLNIPCYFTKDLSEPSFSLSDYKNQEIKYGIVFKPEAIFAKSLSDKGNQILNEINDSDSFIWKNENGGIYQKIGFQNLIKTVLEKEEHNTLNLELFNLNTEGKDSINIFLKSDAEKFKNAIVDFFLNYGLSVNFVENRNSADIVLNHTWFYFENLQSSFDEDLNTAINDYLLDSVEPENIFFLFRSGWNIEKNM